MNENSPCGCTIPKNGYPRCSVCHRKMCPQVWVSFCTDCYYRHKDTPTVDGVTFVLKRDEHGRIIDPIKGFSLLTCTCGLLAIGLTNCKFLWHQQDSGHKPIVLPKSNMG